MDGMKVKSRYDDVGEEKIETTKIIYSSSPWVTPDSEGITNDNNNNDDDGNINLKNPKFGLAPIHRAMKFEQFDILNVPMSDDCLTLPESLTVCSLHKILVGLDTDVAF